MLVAYDFSKNQIQLSIFCEIDTRVIHFIQYNISYLRLTLTLCNFILSNDIANHTFIYDRDH